TGPGQRKRGRGGHAKRLGVRLPRREDPTDHPVLGESEGPRSRRAVGQYRRLTPPKPGCSSRSGLDPRRKAVAMRRPRLFLAAAGGAIALLVLFIGASSAAIHGTKSADAKAKVAHQLEGSWQLASF